MPRLAILLAGVVLAISACGGSNSASKAADTTATASLDLVAKNTAFSAARLTAAAGTVKIDYDNQDTGITHNLHVAGTGLDAKTDIVAGPKRQQLALTVGPGTFTYMCDVHPQQMKGQLVVTPGNA